MRVQSWDILLRWSLWAGVCQLIGTALIVWGLKVTKQEGGGWTFYGKDGPPKYPQAGIVYERRRMVILGIWFLLLGLVLQVVASLL